MFYKSILGTDLPVLEHMREIKEKTSLLNRFYNKKQFFKWIGQKYIFHEEGEETTECSVSAFNEAHYDPWFGKAFGAYVKSGHDDISIIVYRVEDLEECALQFYCEYGESFFMRDDSNDIFYVYIERD